MMKRQENKQRFYLWDYLWWVGERLHEYHLRITGESMLFMYFNFLLFVPVYGLLKPERILLDSLLSEIGCGFILVDRREWGTADSVYVSLVMPYYSHGIVDAGTSKSFVYDPGLRSRRNIRITEHGDLNEIYRRTYNDTTLYKPIKGNWYIELDHSI